MYVGALHNLINADSGCTDYRSEVKGYVLRYEPQYLTLMERPESNRRNGCMEGY